MPFKLTSVMLLICGFIAFGSVAFNGHLATFNVFFSLMYCGLLFFSAFVCSILSISESLLQRK